MDAVFRALADPTRRRILDALFDETDRPSASSRSGSATMTRFGVMKHLGRARGGRPRRPRTTRAYQAAVPQPRTDRAGREPLDQQVRRPFHLGAGRARHPHHHSGRPDGRHGARLPDLHRLLSRRSVWRAITDSDWIRLYFHDTSFVEPPSPGGAYRTVTTDGREAIDGVVEEMTPPKDGQPGRFVQTWHVLYDASLAAEPPGRVEWTIEGVGDGLTRVRLVHGDLAYSPLTWAHVKDGWVWILDALKTLLETGHPLPSPEVRAPVSTTPRATGTAGRASRPTTRSTGCWSAIARPRRTRSSCAMPMLRRTTGSAPRVRAGERGPGLVHGRSRPGRDRPGGARSGQRRSGASPSVRNTVSPTSTSRTPTRRGPAHCQRSGRTTRPPWRRPSRGRCRSPTPRTSPSSRRTSPTCRTTATAYHLGPHS